MLIDFSVSNFRSFRERQTLSLVAAPRLKRVENTFSPDLMSDPIGKLLKVAVIYGPNASGKSNLLKALDAVRRLAVDKPSASARELPVAPFRFDGSLANEPSEFELNFIANKNRYRFVVAATRDRIVQERLFVFPKGRESLLYERVFTEGSERYKFGALLEGGESLQTAWQRLTGPQTLFISQATANSSEDLKQLKTPYSWLDSNLRTVSAGEGMKFMAKVLQLVSRKYPENPLNNVVPFIRDLDVPITKLEFEATEPESPYVELESQADFAKTFREMELKATLTHSTDLGSADFKFGEESDGTQNLLGFFVFWEMLQSNPEIQHVLSVDELDASLHPQIVAQLVRKHLSLEFPRQLIFTTHDTHLMDAKVLRRDQIWLTERDTNGATHLRSIHEYEGRESEDIEKRYYEGRYRGLPILRGV